MTGMEPLSDSVTNGQAVALILTGHLGRYPTPAEVAMVAAVLGHFDIDPRARFEETADE